MGRDVGEALALSDPKPIGVVQEWGVRQLGLAARALDPGRDPQAGHGRPLSRLRRGRRVARGVDAADGGDPHVRLKPDMSRGSRPSAGRQGFARRDPELARDREHVAVLAVERRRGIPLAPVARRAASRRRRSARPRPAAGRSRAVIRASSGSPRPSPVERVGARAVDHGPDDLGPDLARDPGRRDEPVVAAGHAARVDLEPVSLGPRAADEALVEDRAPRAAQRAGGRRGLLEARRRRRRHRRDRRPAPRRRARRRRAAAPARRPASTVSGRSSGGGSRRVTSMPARRRGPARAPPARAARPRSRRWPRCAARGSGGRS